MKVLVSHFLYNEKLKEEKAFTGPKSTGNMEKEKYYIRRDIFKTLAISIIVFQLLITTVPRHIVKNTEGLFCGKILLLR